MSGSNWSRHVHVRRGGLGRWCDRCPASSRHRALEAVARRDGWGTVVRRLNFLANVANRRDNERLHEVARTDERWAERREEGG